MKRTYNLFFHLFIISVSLLRLWLQINLNYIVVYASIDDNVAIMQAESLISGHYLGPYNMMTLAKGYTYPFFLYMCHQLHISYALGLGIISILSHLIILKAFTCLCPNKRLQMLFYCVISFIPVDYAFDNTLYFYRISLSAPLALILIGSLIMMNHGTSKYHLIFWSMLVGISLWSVLNLREDSIWLLIFVLYALGIFVIKRLKEHHIKQLIAALSVIMIVTALPAFGIMRLNQRHYDITLLNDRVAGPFASMMKLMYSVEDPNKNDEVWITYSMLEKCMNVSPSLASIEPCIDHAYHSWAYVYFPESDCIKGDFMQWVMRTALTEAGYYHNNAVKTQAFIESINNELTNAFNNGKLHHDNLFHPSSSIRGISSHDIQLIPKMAQYALMSLRYPQCLLHNPQPIASNEWIKRCEKITGMSLSQASMLSQEKKRVRHICDTLTKLYQLITPITSFLIAIFSLVNRGVKKSLNEIRLWVIGLLISALSLVAMVTLFTTFLNPIDFYKYTTPYMPIVTLIEFLLIADCLEKNV